MIKHTKEELAYLIDNRPPGTEYVAALNAGGDYTEYCPTAVRQWHGQTEEQYNEEHSQHKEYLLESCETLYEVTKEGMIKIWEKEYECLKHLMMDSM